MKLIAHRGLFEGPNTLTENSPDQIDRALSYGFDCEIDLWIIDGQLLLGHDGPQYRIDFEFITKDGLWIHCKNIEALYQLSKYNSDNLNYFWHQNDDFTLTSHGYIWTYPEKALTSRSICVQPEWSIPVIELHKFNQNCYGVCSKYVSLMRDII